MAKYRVLTSEELRELEDEFIKFLVLNGIVADDWNKLKKDPEKADRMIDLFSDVVFEKILREITHLAHYSKSSIKIFFCAEDQIHLIGVDTEDPSIDFTSTADRTSIADPSTADLKIYHASKAYTPDREMELFNMLQNGSVKTDGKLYASLEPQLKK